MKTKLIILPQGNIIVSDEEIKEEDLVLTEKHGIWKYSKAPYPLPYWGNKKRCKKLIASDNSEHNLPSINYNGLEERFGVVDTEKLVTEHLESNHIEASTNRVKVVSELFKKAQSLNDKKFSLEDIIAARDYGQRHGTILWDEFIQSLQQPKVFDIEVEMEINQCDGCVKGDPVNDMGIHHHKDSTRGYMVCAKERYNKSKITNNQIKIIKVL